MSSEVLEFDIAVCGAGPVGLALAAFLVRRGVPGERIVLIDGKSLGQAISDPRSIALSWGSVQLLEDVGAWPLAATPIHQIHVSRRGQLGRSLMDRHEHGLPALGYVTRYGEVVDALARACERAGVAVLRPARVASFDEQGDGVDLQLDDGRTVKAQVAVQAEGGVFGQQEDKSQRRDYAQTAVIARVTVSRPAVHRAFERFTDEGPLALLPQDGGDGHQYALVWCMRPERAASVLELGDDRFLEQLGEAFGARLGRCTGPQADDRPDRRHGPRLRGRRPAATAAGLGSGDARSGQTRPHAAGRLDDVRPPLRAYKTSYLLRLQQPRTLSCQRPLAANSRPLGSNAFMD